MSELFPSMTLMPNSDDDEDDQNRRRTASKITGY
jgi:hypothetical protein